MERNGILYNPDGSKRIGNNTLVALTLMIAESRTEEMDTMVKVIVNLINKNNWPPETYNKSAIKFSNYISRTGKPFNKNHPPVT